MVASPRNDRTFLPSVGLKEAAKSALTQMNELCETLILRIYHLPENIWCEADDVKHVWVDGTAAVEKSVSSLKKFLARDTIKLDDLKFLHVPFEGGVCPTVLLLESYAWTAVCVLSYMLGVVIGASDLLKSMISPIFHPLNALIAAVFLPFFLHTRRRKSYWPEDEQRSEAFYASLLWGTLVSYGVGTPSVRFAQFLALYPLWISTMSGLLEMYPVDRTKYLVGVIGVPFAIYCLYANLALEQSTLYIAAWIALTTVVVTDLQLKLGRIKRRCGGKELEQWETVVVFICAHYLLSQFLSIFANE